VDVARAFGTDVNGDVDSYVIRANRNRISQQDL